MKAKIYTFEEAIMQLTPKNVQGKVIAFPTDTVWGIGCLLNDQSSIKEIYNIKCRPLDKPLAVLCSAQEQMYTLFKNKSNTLETLSKTLMPGGLSVIMEKSNIVSNTITSGKSSVAVRIPKLQPLQNLLQKLGPMPTTSANESGEAPINNFDDIKHHFGELVDIIIKPHDKFSNIETPSTIVLIEDEKLKIIREGAIDKQEIYNKINNVEN